MKRLITKLQQDLVEPELISIIDSLMLACKNIAFKLKQGEFANIIGESDLENVQGETQKKLDIISNEIIRHNLYKNSHVKGVASEEEEFTISANENGKYLVCYDPLDGSSNIDVNIAVGTIFSILKADNSLTGDKEEGYLQIGRKQIAAGFVIYGPSTKLIITTGKGVNQFTLDTTNGEFFETKNGIKIPEATKEFAINMSVQRFWQEPIKKYIADCIAGEDGPLGKRYNMRWVASMVAEVYRILTRGGIFMYPYDNREPIKAGKLRLMYEGNPMSMIVEQAGGLSITGTENILDIKPEKIHQRIPVILGSKQEVGLVSKYHKQ